MQKSEIAKIALENLYASRSGGWSYLCGDEVETFGFYSWDMDESTGREDADEATAREYAESGEYGVAWLVPVSVNDKLEGIALFTGNAGNAPEDEPSFEGIFSTLDQAKQHLRNSGVIDERISSSSVRRQGA
ncbi:MAG: hypothetical protein O9277_13745 [Magnetospirillum sp.]|nr:hypothetical protein [Magnetospirillum sp.]